MIWKVISNNFFFWSKAVILSRFSILLFFPSVINNEKFPVIWYLILVCRYDILYNRVFKWVLITRCFLNLAALLISWSLPQFSAYLLVYILFHLNKLVQLIKNIYFMISNYDMGKNVISEKNMYINIHWKCRKFKDFFFMIIILW